MSRSLRDDALTAIRPVTHVETVDIHSVEGFQADCLIPILRLQEDIIFSLIRAHRASGEPGVGITETMNQESLRDRLIGVVVGHLTVEEMDFYLANREELNRWILEILSGRIEGQLDLSFVL